MRITITTPDPAIVFLRRAGYGFQKEEGAEIAFIRRVGGGDFPRYHAYVQERPGQLTVSLHIDQKAPTYGNGRAHSGDYEGPLLEQEASRLRALPPAAPESKGDGDDRGGFFSRLFG